MIPAAAFIPIIYVFGLPWRNPHAKTTLIGFWLLSKDEGLNGAHFSLITGHGQSAY